MVHSGHSVAAVVLLFFGSQTLPAEVVEEAAAGQAHLEEAVVVVVAFGSHVPQASEDAAVAAPTAARTVEVEYFILELTENDYSMNGKGLMSPLTVKNEKC